MSCGWYQNAQPAAQLSRQQLTAEEKEVDQGRLGDQHLEKIYRQEQSAGARKTMAADRVRWRNLLPIVPQGTGRSKC